MLLFSFDDVEFSRRWNQTEYMKSLIFFVFRILKKNVWVMSYIYIFLIKCWFCVLLVLIVDYSHIKLKLLNTFAGVLRMQ